MTFFVLLLIIFTLITILFLFSDITDYLPFVIVCFLIFSAVVVVYNAKHNAKHKDEEVKLRYDELIIQYNLGEKGFSFDPEDDIEELEARILPFLQQYNLRMSKKLKKDVYFKEAKAPIKKEKAPELKEGYNLPKTAFQIDW